VINKRTVRKFFTAFGITIVAALVAWTGGVAAMRNFVAPPEVEQQVFVVLQPPIPLPPPSSISDENEAQNDEVFIPAPPPEIVAVMDRRPLFFTFLLFGLDYGGLTDTIMVGAFDGENSTGYVINIPRDTKVETNRNQQKINAAYAVGQLNGRGHEGGVALLKQDIQLLLGFVPDFYVGVNFEAFTAMVDAVGGIEIDVPFHMRYTHRDAGAHIDIPAGLQRMDGETALNFARFRRSDSGFRSITDFGRIENQQQVMSALLSEILTPQMIVRVPEFIRIYQEHVVTDLENGEILWFAEQLANIDGIDAFSAYTLPIRGNTGRAPWYEYPDRVAILELVNSTVNPFIQEITAEMVRIP